MTGEAVPLLDLVERGIIRVLDALFVIKEEDGTYAGFEATELDDKGVGDFAAFEGASSDCSATTTGDGRGRDRAGDGGGRDRLREPLGGAVCRRGAPQRRSADRLPADPDPGADRVTRGR